MDARDAQGETPLERAAWESSCPDAIPVLLAHGADPDASGGSRGSYVLSLAQGVPTSEQLGILRSILRRLAHKPSPDTLYLAVRDGRLEVARLLLQYGADPNQPSLWSGTKTSPLATAEYLDDERMVRLLLSYGADPVHRGGPAPELEQAMRLPGPPRRLRALFRHAETDWRRKHPAAGAQGRRR